MINIAIDGPSGAGKSSLSDYVAKELSFVHVDTGALYRAVGFYLVKNKVEPSDAAKVVPVLESLNVNVEYDSLKQQHVFVNGEEVDEQLRTNDVQWQLLRHLQFLRFELFCLICREILQKKRIL